MSQAKNTTATLVPSLRYVDAPAAIERLCRAFGFDSQLVVCGEGDTVAHAQLVFGHGMIMLGSAGTHGGGYDDLVSTPTEVGTNTQSAYVIVEDADAHYAGAKAAGAVQVGGEMIDRAGSVGSGIADGTRHPVAAGDMLHIPAGMPHGYLVPDGGHITYVLVRVPAVLWETR
jgi:uncharacterized glyoxalase superfamily protein PhnB